MKQETFKKAEELRDKIKHEAKLLDNTKTQKCEYIIFTFGNFSDKSLVSDDPEIINKVKELITKETELKLYKLKEEFELL